MAQQLYHAVAFDLDGTLLDTLADLANATNAALARAGYPTHPTPAYRRFVGSGLEQLVRRALPAGEETHLDPEKLADMIAHTATTYERDWALETRPYPHIPELLAELCRRDVPLSIVTNKPQPWTLKIIDRYFPDTPFVCVQGAVPELPHKPDPTGALGVAARMGLHPQNIAFLGDSDVDMHTARNAGMGAIGAGWGFRGEEELIRSGAETVLKDPLELLSLLV